MKVKGEHYRTIWPSEDGDGVWIIDQTALPHRFEICKLTTLGEAADAIRAMRVRGAPLIGATAAYGVYLAMKTDASDRALEFAYDLLLRTRPTAINLRWALDRVKSVLAPLLPMHRKAGAFAEAQALCDADVATNRAIGEHGLELIRRAVVRRRRTGETGPLQILTHCNAGWLGTVDWGTALAPIYLAHEEGINLHVWVDETRPRNQGASLTTWELAQHGVPYSLIVDNAGGHLMQHNQVDLCIVGADRVTSQGDACNKIGTYLKALAAWDNGVPFYVALPSSTIDWTIEDGVDEIPIEERSPEEVTRISGLDNSGQPVTVNLVPEGCPAKNYGFDVTPQRLITAFVTERGLCAPSSNGLRGLFADLAPRRSALPRFQAVNVPEIRSEVLAQA